VWCTLRSVTLRCTIANTAVGLHAVTARMSRAGRQIARTTRLTRRTTIKLSVTAARRLRRGSYRVQVTDRPPTGPARRTSLTVRVR